MSMCDLCGSGESSTLCRAGKFRLANCDRCGLAFLDPQPTDRELDEYYADDYYSFSQDAEHPAKLRGRLYSAITKQAGSPSFLLMKYLRDSRVVVPFGNKRLLDVGCGSGEYLYLMRELGWEAYGIETSEKAIKYGREKYGLKIFAPDSISAEFPAGFFDLITFYHSLEHLRSPKEMLLKSHTLLKDKGKIVLETPNIKSIEFYLFKCRWDSLKIPTHLFLFSPATIRLLLRDTGFIVSKLTWVHTHEGIPRSIFCDRPALIKATRLPFIPINIIFDLLGHGGIMKIEGLNIK